MKRTLLGLMAVGLGVGLLGCSSSTESRGFGTGVGNAKDADGDGIPDSTDPTPNGDGSGSPGGGGPGGGSGGDPGGGGPGPGDNCEMHTVMNNNATPDMLIVLDKSGSMKMEGVNRWDPSVEGLKAITSATTTQVAFGLMSFPVAGDQCGAGQLDEPIALNNAGAIASALDGMMPSGGTPTSATLVAAHEFFNAQQADPDSLPHPQYVLLVTDGAPNCGAGGSAPMRPSCSLFSNDPVCQQMWQDFFNNAGGGFNQGEVDATVAAIAAMAADGIKTYVIGYDTQSDPMLSGAMDMMAAAGDTGDTKHRPVENKDELVEAFQEIAGSAISCEFVLDEPAPDPSYVLVEIDNAQINLNDPNGWILSEDKKKITVQGSACTTLQDGTEHILNVEVQCDIVTPI